MFIRMCISVENSFINQRDGFRWTTGWSAKNLNRKHHHFVAPFANNCHSAFEESFFFISMILFFCFTTMLKDISTCAMQLTRPEMFTHKMQSKTAGEGIRRPLHVSANGGQRDGKYLLSCQLAFHDVRLPDFFRATCRR